MSVTVEAFRAAFPEFADVPDAAVAGALETASLLWNPAGSGSSGNASSCFPWPIASPCASTSGGR